MLREIVSLNQEWKGEVKSTAILGLSERSVTKHRLTRMRTLSLTDMKRQKFPSSKSKTHTESSCLVFMKNINSPCDRANGKTNRH